MTENFFRSRKQSLWLTFWSIIPLLFYIMVGAAQQKQPAEKNPTLTKVGDEVQAGRTKTARGVTRGSMDLHSHSPSFPGLTWTRGFMLDGGRIGSGFRAVFWGF